MAKNEKLSKVSRGSKIRASSSVKNKRQLKFIMEKELVKDPVLKKLFTPELRIIRRNPNVRKPPLKPKYVMRRYEKVDLKTIFPHSPKTRKTATKPTVKNIKIEIEELPPLCVVDSKALNPEIPLEDFQLELNVVPKTEICEVEEIIIPFPDYFMRPEMRDHDYVDLSEYDGYDGFLQKPLKSEPEEVHQILGFDDQFSENLLEGNEEELFLCDECGFASSEVWFAKHKEYHFQKSGKKDDSYKVDVKAIAEEPSFDIIDKYSSDEEELPPKKKTKINRNKKVDKAKESSEVTTFSCVGTEDKGNPGAKLKNGVKTNDDAEIEKKNKGAKGVSTLKSPQKQTGADGNENYKKLKKVIQAKESSKISVKTDEKNNIVRLIISTKTKSAKKNVERKNGNMKKTLQTERVCVKIDKNNPFEKLYVQSPPKNKISEPNNVEKQKKINRARGFRCCDCSFIAVDYSEFKCHKFYQHPPPVNMPHRKVYCTYYNCQYKTYPKHFNVCLNLADNSSLRKPLHIGCDFCSFRCTTREVLRLHINRDCKQLTNNSTSFSFKVV